MNLQNLSHPYGRHSCLYVEVKVDANEKPNPQEVVGLLFLRDISALTATLSRYWKRLVNAASKMQTEPQR